MSRLQRILSGSHHRKTRFHDEKGNPVGLAGLCHAPAALWSALARRGLGRAALKPMIGYGAIARLDRLIAPDWRIVEFGTGRSTPWLARRCAFVLAIEDDPAWHDRVAGLLAASNCGNVQLELRPPARFADLSAWPEGHFDFALVDGTDRDGCIAAALPRLRDGGWLYLDNTDKDMADPAGDLRRAERRLHAFLARHPRYTIEYFTDFAPTNFFAEQGALVRIRR